MDPVLLFTIVCTALVVVVFLLLVAVSCVLRASRLNRLHVRTDAARAALLAALERRAVVARAVALNTGDVEMHRTAALAELAFAADRESRENDLARLLGRLDRQNLPTELLTELDDAEQRVMLARRVHNDAVRDTLALRSRRLVRWLRLAGKAPAPSYFEIFDTHTDDDGPTVQALRPRRTGRVVLLNRDGRVLLFEGSDAGRPQESYWFTPGGGLAPGEDARAAALRELAEETGVRLPPERLVGPVWQRRSVFSIDSDGVAADETFFLAVLDARDGEAVDTSGFTDLGRTFVLRHRWWSLEELRDTGEIVYPRQLADLVESLRPGVWDGVTRAIS